MIPLVSLPKESYLMKMPSEPNTVFFTEGKGDEKLPNKMQIALKEWIL